MSIKNILKAVVYSLIICSSTYSWAVEIGYYQHVKGGLYYVVGVARSSEDAHQEYVVYQSLYESRLQPENTPLPSGTLWIRPKDMFDSLVKDSQGMLVPRFKYLGDKLPERLVPEHIFA